METQTQEPKVETLAQSAILPGYSKRVVLKTILGRGDGGLGLIGEKVVIGGWVKSSKEIRKERGQEVVAAGVVSPVAKDVTCVEILQSRIPLFRSIMRVFGGNYPLREKLESVIQKPPPPSIVFLQVSDGSCVASLQVVVDFSLAPPSQIMHTGTCILAEGILRQPSAQGKHFIELKAEKFLHIGVVDHEKYPLTKTRLPLETLRDHAHFRSRTTTVASITRIRNALTVGTHTFFQNHGFLHVQIPIITTTDCEGNGEKFQVTTLLDGATKMEDHSPPRSIDLEVIKAAIKEKSKTVEELKRTGNNNEALVAATKDLHETNELALVLEAEAKDKSKSEPRRKNMKMSNNEEFFSRSAYLTSSGRPHLECYACALGNVYSFGPRYRVERFESSKHLAETWMVELEMAFSQFDDAVNCAEDFLKFLCKWVLENCSEDLKFVSKRIDKTIIDRLQSMVWISFEKISYAEAVNALKEVKDKTFVMKIESGLPLTEEHKSFLVDEIYKKPLMIYNYPKELKPFYVHLNDDGRTVAAFDMIVPKVGTLISGSQNEECLGTLNARIKELKMQKEQYEWYLDLRRHGTVKHSGFSLGFDLMVLFATGLIDLRDVTPFPRSYGEISH